MVTFPIREKVIFISTQRVQLKTCFSLKQHRLILISEFSVIN